MKRGLVNAQKITDYNTWKGGQHEPLNMSFIDQDMNVSLSQDLYGQQIFSRDYRK